ncbi:glycosyltransferase family 4 protein [Sphingopyxis granuli]|uniref:glycosyltransferase family 4 protein n=1 Tax=Sphingopyxis granuli TaxID=267128 RepID=UPI000832FBA9|nr:glycosyltransferase family 4 protein [Sphingopyxis granuli]
MRIAHICLAAFYIDGFGYQENILPRIHRKMGHEVMIVASTETYLDRTRLGYVEPSSYINEDGVPVHRLPYASWIPKRLQAKVRAYKGVERLLEEFRPDLIFVHDVQFWDFLAIRRYVLRRPTPVYADCHTDYVNSARGFVSRHILHGLFYRAILRRVSPIVQRFLPTLPVRGDFLHEVYGLDRAKMELLPFGVDDTQTEGLDREQVRREARAEWGVPDDALLFVTGGKLDLRKNIHTLIDRFSRAKREGELGDAHLLVFGQATPEVQAELDAIDIHEHVHMLGWTPANEIYRAFWAADFALFPGTHSVLWEEAIGHGLGAVFHHWRGMDHLDLGGNARIIQEAAPEALDRLLRELVANDGAEIRRMNSVAAEKGSRVFSFSAIAAKAIA